MYKSNFDRPIGGRSLMKLQAKMLALTVALMSVLSMLAVASPADAAASPQIKPVPVAPKLPVQGEAKPPQLRSINPNIAALVAWNATLSTSSSSLWPTQYAVLTAHSNQDVGPTPYWLRIHDNTSNTYVATCGYGTACTATVTQPTATTHSYTAVISYNVSTYPPSGLQASSPAVSVTWKSIGVTLAASPTTVNIGASSTLTATTTADVGPTPFYTEIFDVNTGVRIGVCGGGTTCSASTTQYVATTHQFVAYVSRYSSTLPPDGVQATSGRSLVTWANTGYRISLSAPSFAFGTATATATVNVNVGPTPYWIQLFNQNGTRLAVCGNGTTCSATFTPSVGGTRIVAFVSNYSTSYLPAGIQASSNVTNTRTLFFTSPLRGESLDSSSVVS